MAAPPSKTVHNYSGNWTMNKKLSENFEPILAMQGISWTLRKILNMATVTLHSKSYVDAEGIEHVDIQQTATGGIKGNPENRVLNGVWKEHTDNIFGEMRGMSKLTKLSELEAGMGLEERDWIAEGMENPEGDFILTYVENKKAGWTGNQIWGFGEIDGVRYWVRKAIVKKKGEMKKARLVYDFKEELTEVPADK